MKKYGVAFVCGIVLKTVFTGDHSARGGVTVC